MANIYLELIELAQAADSNIVGGASLTPEMVLEAGWFVYTRVDGARIRIDTSDGQAPLQAAIDIVMNTDMTQPAIDARAIVKARNITMEIFLNDESSLARITRALSLVLMDEINLLRASVVVGVATATWDAPSIANNIGTTSPVLTVTGAVIGDVVDVAPPVNPNGLIIYGYVSAANSVQIRLFNNTGATVNLASGTWGVAVRRPRNLTPRTTQDLQNAATAKIQVG